MNRDDVIRAFPHAVGPEKSILSSMIQYPDEYIGFAIEFGISSATFYFPAHQVIFAEMLKRYEKGEPIELVSFTQSLLDQGTLDRAGGPAALADIYTYAPSPGHFAYHLKGVKDKFALRSLLNFCATTEESVWSDPEEVDQLLDTSEAAILAIREGREVMSVESIKLAVERWAQRLKERLEGKSNVGVIATGFAGLDRKMGGGLRPGEVFVIAARPSMGKTSLMLDIVAHVALAQGMPAMVFSCEMTRDMLVERLIHSEARFPTTSLNDGYRPTKSDLQGLMRAASAVANSGIIIDDTEAITISKLRAKARRKKRECGIRLIAIDYIQLMRSDSKQAAGSREREIAEISAGVKGLAKELGVPIILLAQLNRGPEKRGFGDSIGKPRLSDLRESGSIEQDADQVGLLYRPAYYAEYVEDKMRKAGEAELILAKNRGGETGIVDLTFIEEQMRFENGKPVKKLETAQSHWSDDRR